jgi:predicted TIM-barrel fold metal-dependent hydrolase
MSGDLRIDAHTHVWPDHLAERALDGAFPELPRRGDGKLASLQTSLQDAGIDAAVCLGVAVEARQVGAANRFVASLPENVIGFGSVHPSLNAEDVLSDLRVNHLRGVKIHPIVQDFRLDDPRLRPILDALSGEFVTVIHVGGGGPLKSADNAHPDQLRRLVRDFPRLNIIACHFGGYRMYQEALDCVVGLRVYLDTSWPPGLATLDARRVTNLIERHGPDRVVFGSDWPMADIRTEVLAIEQLDLPEEQTDAILGGNLQRMLKIQEA